MPNKDASSDDDLFDEESDLDTIDVHAVCQRAMTKVSGALRQPLPIETDFAVVPPVYAKDAELFQVMVNVLLSAEEVGARDDSGPPRVLLVSRAAHGRVILEVHAGGAVSGATTRHAGTQAPVDLGSLGLTVCEKILRAVGGDLAMERRGDRGLAFRITLEARRTSERLEASKADAPPTRAPTPLPMTAVAPRAPTPPPMTAVAPRAPTPPPMTAVAPRAPTPPPMTATSPQGAPGPKRRVTREFVSVTDQPPVIVPKKSE
jgi:hypothetical protein